MDYLYDVTVLIPVYNASKYLDKCLDSVLKQAIDLKIEILLLDDGSTDNSLDICKKYEAENDNVKLYHHDNHGVSYTRNEGLKKAQGKYILMLDSDDYLEMKAIYYLYTFFEEYNDEIDIVTYPLIEVYENNKLKELDRYKRFDKGTAVYDINEYPYLNQTTINIMFKNTNDIFFDENLFIGEDTKFATELIMRKEKIGYVKEAIYYYRRNKFSTSLNKLNPYYSFNDMLKFYNWLIDTYAKNNKLLPYLQVLILLNINHRILTDNLFPYHLEGKAYDDAYQKIINVINYLSTDVIFKCKFMYWNHKFYIFNLQKKKAKVKYKNNKYLIYIDNILLVENDKVDFTITRFKIKNNKIEIMGYANTILHQYVNPEIYLSYIDKDNQEHDEKLDLYTSNWSYNNSKIKTNQFYGFRCIIDINKVKKFAFYVRVKNYKFYGKYSFTKWVPFNKSLGRYRVICNNKMIILYKDKKYYHILPITFKDHLLLPLKEVKKYGLINPKILVYRHFRHKKKKTIWLYNDSKGIFDNAYDQFKHDFKMEDDIERYYIYRDKLDIIKDKFTMDEQKYLVSYGTLEHKKLFLNADKIITSFSDFSVYSPFIGSFKYYSDLMNYDLIYLQHGILHASLITMYSKEFTQIDKVVISSSFEKDNLINNYNYNLDDLIQTGMSRFKKVQERKPSHKIVFAPSWRNYLVGEFRNGIHELMEDVFLNSKFYKYVNAFLNSKKLQELLEENDYKLEFKLHPIFRGYKDLFTFKNSNIVISFDEIDVTDYDLCITDFSSFQFDFVWNKIPIIYFVPDMMEFKAGLHTYRKLDLPYDEAFGPLCQTDDELLSYIKHLMDNNMQVDDIYINRMNNFFKVSDNPPEEIYKYLINNK